MSTQTRILLQNRATVHGVEVPARKVTACVFGGEDLDQLFVTTSREDLEPGEDPLAGSLFRASDVGVAGLPAREFAG